MSDHANPAADILPRSIWESRGNRVQVLATAGGYVRYQHVEGPPAMLAHHAEFRRYYAPLYDRRQVKSQFSMSTCNQAEFTAYWLPAKKKLVTRAISCQRQFRIPAGAIQIGVYSHPFNADAFLKDLDLVLAAIDHAAGNAAAN